MEVKSYSQHEGQSVHEAGPRRRFNWRAFVSVAASRSSWESRRQ